MAIAYASGALIYGGSMAYLNQVWYKPYRTNHFHFFNDNNEWLQMDKIGHGFSAYYISQLAYSGLLWAGNSRKKSLWYGTGVSVLVMSSIELMDGYSSGWGASWGDILANTLGAGLFVFQEKLWKEQRIQLKFSVFPSKYAQYRPTVLGKNFGEQIIKDYNGQTYWASFNLPSLFQTTNLPHWLNLSIGHSVKGLLGGYSNPTTNSNGEVLPVFTRKRQWLLAPDVDLTKIKSKKKWVRTCLKALNTLKIPSPALEFNGKAIQWHWIYF